MVPVEITTLYTITCKSNDKYRITKQTQNVPKRCSAEESLVFLFDLCGKLLKIKEKMAIMGLTEECAAHKILVYNIQRRKTGRSIMLRKACRHTE